jgi:imidazoleglycerol phosphate synthase glutamine amidotransferase subunit HisH
MTHVAVIDYGMGNLHSVAKALEHVGKLAGTAVKVSVTSDPDTLRAADRLVFPGVGAMRDCMAEIRHLCIDEILREQVREKPSASVCRRSCSAARKMVVLAASGCLPAKSGVSPIMRWMRRAPC